MQRSGLAWRMSARHIADLARNAEPVMQQLVRYTQALFAHMAPTSACHRHHLLETQLCRWLQHLDPGRRRSRAATKVWSSAFAKASVPVPRMTSLPPALIRMTS